MYGLLCTSRKPRKPGDSAGAASELTDTDVATEARGIGSIDEDRVNRGWHCKPIHAPVRRKVKDEDDMDADAVTKTNRENQKQRQKSKGQRQRAKSKEQRGKAEATRRGCSWKCSSVTVALTHADTVPQRVSQGRRRQKHASGRIILCEWHHEWRTHSLTLHTHPQASLTVHVRERATNAISARTRA